MKMNKKRRSGRKEKWNSRSKSVAKATGAHVAQASKREMN
jgi:hypothetical protein